jgi:hypothetical protein
LSKYLSGSFPENEYRKYFITPVKYLGSRIEGEHSWDQQRWEMVEWAVEDNRGRAFTLNSCIWEGNADANTGAFGEVYAERLGGEQVLTLDGMGGDCVTLITVKNSDPVSRAGYRPVT